MSRYVIDIDLTLCDTQGNDYKHSLPRTDIVQLVNRLYDKGHTILIFTGRGSRSGIDWEDFTKTQLAEWGIKYHELIMGKPDTDYIVDDKSISLAELKGSDPELIKEFVSTFKAGMKVLVCGNGGFAADASHFSAELMGKYAFEIYLPCVCLADSSALMTALANDMKFENVFSHQIRVLGQRGDIFIGMTTSQSPNIVGAERVAHEKGLTTVMVCGYKSQVQGDYIIRMQGNDTAQIQNNAIQFLHALAYSVKKVMWEGKVA